MLQIGFKMPVVNANEALLYKAIRKVCGAVCSDRDQPHSSIFSPSMHANVINKCNVPQNKGMPFTL